VILHVSVSLVHDLTAQIIIRSGEGTGISAFEFHTVPCTAYLQKETEGYGMPRVCEASLTVSSRAINGPPCCATRQSTVGHSNSIHITNKYKNN
jgi:hypothetical protein